MAGGDTETRNHINEQGVKIMMQYNYEINYFTTNQLLCL